MLSNPRCKNQNVRFLESRMSFVGGEAMSGWGSGVGHLETSVHSRVPAFVKTHGFASLAHMIYICQYDIYVIYVPFFHIDTISGIPETN